MTRARLRNWRLIFQRSSRDGVYLVSEAGDQLGTVHRGTDPMPRYWYAYCFDTVGEPSRGYVGSATTRRAAAELLRKHRRRARK